MRHGKTIPLSRYSSNQLFVVVFGSRSKYSQCKDKAKEKELFVPGKMTNMW